VFGGLAQLVERLLCKQDVSGSSPLTSIRSMIEARANGTLKQDFNRSLVGMTRRCKLTMLLSSN
jgi:hypothetical protein